MDITQEIIEYYKVHTLEDTHKHFKNIYGLSRRKVDALVKDSGFVKERPRKLTDEEKALNFISSVDTIEFSNYYMEYGGTKTREHYKIYSSGIFKSIRELLNLPSLSSKEVYDKKCIREYGDAKVGRKIYFEKSKDKIDYESLNQKRAQTNLEKYGCVSPFGNAQVRQKAHETVQQRYGVDNVFQSEEVKNKIKEIQDKKYGGIGFASPLLSQRYNDIMLEKYGVMWGCQLPKCVEKNNGNNSKPNQYFETLLNKEFNFIGVNGVNKEIPIDSFRYDFKLNNTLIEIDPSYTHNSTIGYHGLTPIEKNYHQQKSECAVAHGYRCVHVFDWDDVYKIIQLFKDRPKVFARKCLLKVVNDVDAKEFLCKYHLQGYVKSTLNLGLYYENTLVSIMTFGKPRYNKKYQWELLRYCSIYDVVGGAQKLFSYFIKNQQPESIISYCDLSKFEGSLYNKLGFIKSNKNIIPSKHWYSLKTGQHITDNLLRQRGFDQLFNTNYGKGTSNEDLMRTNYFVEVYDCGQSTYVWKSTK